MVLMEKDNSKEYVPDVFIEHYRSLGYKVVGEPDDVQKTVEEVQPTKPRTPRKRKTETAGALET